MTGLFSGGSFAEDDAVDDADDALAASLAASLGSDLDESFDDSFAAGTAASPLVPFSLSAALTGGGSSPAVSFFRSSRCSADTPMSRIALTTLPRTGE